MGPDGGGSEAGTGDQASQDLSKPGADSTVREAAHPEHGGTTSGGNPARSDAKQRAHPPSVPAWTWPFLGTIAVAVIGQSTDAWWAALAVVLILGGSLAVILGAHSGHLRVVGVAVSVMLASGAVWALFWFRAPIQSITASPSTSGPTVPSVTSKPVVVSDSRGADLRGRDLSRQLLARYDLRGADLAGANLAGADLSNALLDGADLRGADLHDACLRGAHLRGAELRGADFTGADIRGALLDPEIDALPTAWPPTPSGLVRCTS